MFPSRIVPQVGPSLSGFVVLVAAKEAAKMLEVVDAKLVDIAAIRDAEGANSGQKLELRELCGRTETRISRSYINVDLSSF